MEYTWEQIAENALRFSKRWADAHNERAEAQLFLHELFGVFGVDTKRVATFEQKVHPESDKNGYIDLLWKGRILIEMKSRGRSLERAYTQARNYAFSIEDDEDLPEYIMVCDFERIRLYRQTTNQNWEFKVKALKKHIKKLSILTEHATKYDFVVDKELNTKAAYKMARLHDTLKEHGYAGHALEVYLVRLLFCLFADDAGIFHSGAFYQYLLKSKENGSDLSGRIVDLFDVLNTPYENRQSTLSEELKSFPYVNGGLFTEMLRPASFDIKMRESLIDCCTFDWSGISPSIFGAMFQGVMDPDERRALGAHYTSEQNILKVIKPLFLDELYEEFEHVKSNDAKLEYFHKKLSNLTFLDPACGCGNFLIITYRELRLLELEVLKMQIENSSQLRFGEILDDYIKVNVNQFYGIEYEDFPCEIAKVGMWLMDHLMNNIVAEHFGIPFVRLPLQASATVVHGNALEVDWNNIIPSNNLSYIISNPPFVGARIMNGEQKDDILSVFGKIRGVGNLDYVAAWYKKAADIMVGTNIRTAFVSTNSISQGEQVSILWEPLFSQQKVKINFAYRTFKWNNEAKGNAAVHCVIIGFSTNLFKRQKVIFNSNGESIDVNNINAYLVDAPNVFVHSRKKPICDIPEIDFGNMPNDAKGLLSNISKELRELLINEFPITKNWIRPFVGAEEFINNIPRYCLWLTNVSPSEINKIPPLKDILRQVRDKRASSNRTATIKLSETPYLFGEIRQPNSQYIFIPRHSSEIRRYVPIGFLEPNIIAGDSGLVIADASLYHFGILTSNVHNAWIRAVCGRLKSDYRYSKDIVYNNFPWPDITNEQKAEIERLAQVVIDSRSIFKESTLAELYNPLLMPKELIKAHHDLDRVIWKAYKANWKSEAECVADLMQRYKTITLED